MARHPSSIEWVHCSCISVSKIPVWFSLQLSLLQSILFTAAELYFKIRNWTLSPLWFKPRLLIVASRAQKRWPKLIFPVCLQIGKVPSFNEFFSFFSIFGVMVILASDNYLCQVSSMSQKSLRKISITSENIFIEFRIFAILLRTFFI